MNISAVSSLVPSWAQLRTTTGSGAAGTGGTSQASSIAQPAGTAQISPAAQLLSTLQQLQQQSPGQFKQAVSNIATGLQKQAQQALSNGDTAEAGQLNQLAAAFRKSAQTGQLPSAQDLQGAALGAHVHHRLTGNLLSGLPC
jgi:hypothetical protein